VRRHIHGLALMSTCLILSTAGAQQHSFTVNDDIEMVRFSNALAPEDATVVKVSPDSRYFAVVTSRGIIESDEIESTISLYRSAECNTFLREPKAGTAPRPRTLIKMASVLTTEQSSGYGAVITNLRWTSSSDGLYFLAEGVSGERRLYRINIASKQVRPISPKGYHVERFDFTKNVVVYSTWRAGSSQRPMEENENDTNKADARAVTGQSIENILFPPDQLSPTTRDLWVVRNHRGHLETMRLPRASQRDNSSLSETFTVSPDGHMLVRLQPVLNVPTNWTLYEPAKGFEYRRINSNDPGLTAADNILRLKEYSIVNLDNGSIAMTVQAPQDLLLAYTQDNEAVWSVDGRRVLLTNTFLPLDGVSERQRTRRLRPCAIAEVQLPSQKVTCIAFVPDLLADGISAVVRNSLSFGDTDNEIQFQAKLSKGGVEVKRYTFASDAWLADSPDAQARDAESKDTVPDSGLAMIVKQDMNEPPALWLSERHTGQSKELWDPNPQFANLQFGHAAVYRWRDKDNHEWKGGLVTPVGYVPERRYPLVVQIYNFDESEFLTDGSFPTAFAARELASAGIVALQIQRRMPHNFNFAAADDELAGIESAIDHLSEEGLVDPQKVGLVGFSASCWYVEYALIKASHRFAAATIADGIDMSYMQYRLWGVSSPPLEQESEKLIGAKPVGEGLQQWLERAPGFHLDQVRSPLRIEAITPISVLGEWEIYSSLKQERKPVDLIYFPEGQHIHQKPLERLASQQGDVDWFRFWLQDHEDPDASKRGEYRRWEEMRRLDVLPPR
jgi:dipeptidyl aminopeptidase/acylaminoacyl peptidase